MAKFEESTRHPYGKAVGTLIDRLASLPGIGRKSAERLANHLLACPVDEANALSDAIRQVKSRVHQCSVCFNLTEMIDVTSAPIRVGTITRSAWWNSRGICSPSRLRESLAEFITSWGGGSRR